MYLFTPGRWHAGPYDTIGAQRAFKLITPIFHGFVGYRATFANSLHVRKTLLNVS